MKKGKAPGNDGITNAILRLGGPEIVNYLTRAFNEILKTKKMTES